MQGAGDNGAGAHGGDSVRERQHAHTREGGVATVARRGVVALLLCAFLVPSAAAAAPSASAPSARQTDQRDAKQRAATRKREARRARDRVRLRAALRRNPKATLRSGFLRRAAVAGLRMPATVRLREGTDLGVSWVPTKFPLDGALFPAPAGEQTLALAGTFPIVIDFGAGPGYGGPGNLQARSGPGGSITAAGPLVIAEPAGCAGTPPAFVEAATTTSGGAPIVASAATQTWIDMNPFTGLGDGYLDLKLSVRSRVLGSAATCATPGPSADYDVPVTTPATDPWNAPVRIRWDGSFRIAPAITADGAIRFGKMTADAAVQPQGATSGNLWGCAAEAAITGAGLPLSTPCTSAAPLGETVSPAPFPATLVMKRFSADILLGDRN